jgi:uncharacterized protein YndB with AHSA1/START domain
MSVETVPAVRIRRVIRAERQAVWDAWTKPEMMMKWSCPVPGGLKGVDCDLRVGGAFELRMEVEEGVKHTAFGVYREVDEPGRLVYTWDWREEDNAMGDTLVTVEFTEVDGGTEVVVIHEGFPVAEAREGHLEGWTACMANFEAIFA